MNTAISLPPTSSALVIHEDGSSELSFPTRPDDADVPKQEIFLAAVATLMQDAVFVDDVIRRVFQAAQPTSH